MKNMTFNKEELVYIMRGLSSLKTNYQVNMIHFGRNWKTLEQSNEVGLLMEKIKNIESISFDKLDDKELDYIQSGLYGRQQSYGGGYFPHEDKVKYKHFKNVRSIIEKVEGKQKTRRAK